MDAAPPTAEPSATDEPVVEGIDRGPVTDWLAANVAGSVAPLRLRAHRRGPVQPDLPGDRRRRARLRPAPSAGQPRAAHGPRHGPRAHGHQRPAAHRRAGAPHPRPVHRPRRQRRPVLRDVVRRRPHPPRRAGVGRGCPSRCRPGPASRSSTPWPGLHAVDVDAVGLGDFARREGYIARQLKRWHGQFDAVDPGRGARPGRRRPGVHELLADTIPDQQGVGHRARRLPARQHRARRRRRRDRHPRLGDLHPRRPAGRPRPAARLLGRGRRPRPVAARRRSDRRCPASPPGPSCVERYAAAVGRDVSHVAYYRAFGIWKLACILQGVYVRYAGGAAAGDRSGVDQFADTVIRLGERALADVEAL